MSSGERNAGIGGSFSDRALLTASHHGSCARVWNCARDLENPALDGGSSTRSSARLTPRRAGTIRRGRVLVGFGVVRQTSGLICQKGGIAGSRVMLQVTKFIPEGDHAILPALHDHRGRRPQCASLV